MKKALITIMVLLSAAPVFAYTVAEWDAKFIRELVALRYLDLAEERLEQLDKATRNNAEKSRVHVDIGQGILETVESAERMPLEQQVELLEFATRIFNVAAKADPEATKTVKFRTELALLNQKRATINSLRAQRAEDEQTKKDLSDRAIAGFTQALAEFDEVVKLVNEELSKMFRDPDMAPEKIDKFEWDFAVLKLRRAIAWYSYVEAFDVRPDDPKRAEVVKKTFELLEDVAWQGERSSIAVYAHYYEGLLHKKTRDHAKAVEAFEKVFEEDSQVRPPQIMPRFYLEYADALTNAGDHRKAVETISQFQRTPMVRGYEIQADLALSTALFAWAHQLQVQNSADPRIREYYDRALAIARRIVQNNPQWRPTAENIISTWTARFEGGDEDPTVLMASARMAFVQKDYERAADNFQKVMSVMGGQRPRRANDAMRTEAVFFLARSYYERKMYYEAAAVAEWAITRFNPESHNFAESAFYVGIKALADLQQQTNDSFDRNKHIEFRRRLGEEDFNLFIADERMNEGKFEQAIGYLQKITSNSRLYDVALFRIAECYSKIGRAQLENRDTQGIQTLTEAQKRYIAFLEWSIGNPARGEAAVRRQNLESRTLLDLGWLFTNRTAENYYRQLIKHNAARRPAMLSTLQQAAEALLQPGPEQEPENVEQAEAILDELVRLRAGRFLELSADFGTRFPDATEVHPYILYYRVMAALRFDCSETAVEDIVVLENSYPNFRAHALYGGLASLLDRRARRLEEEGEEDQAARYFNSALHYFVKLLNSNPNQEFATFSYIITLAYNRGTQMAAMEKLELIDLFFNRFRNEPARQEEMDNIHLIRANLHIERSELEEALEIFKQIEQRYAPIQGETRRAPHYWAAKTGLARVRKTLGQHNEAAADFLEIQGNVPTGGPTWWEATTNLIDCMILGKHENPAEEKTMKRRAIGLIQNLVLTRPSLGGRDNRTQFIGMLQTLKNTEFEAEAQKLVETIQNLTGE